MRVNSVMILVVLSTHTELAMETVRGRSYWETGQLGFQSFSFFAHSKGSGMNKLRFFFFTEYDILQINIFVTIF